MKHMLDFEASLSDEPRPARFRRATLDDAVGVGGGPHAQETALLVRAFENQNDVVESYYGSWLPVAIARIRMDDRERLEFAAGPSVQDRKAARDDERSVADGTRFGYLEAACGKAESYFGRAAQRRAQQRYLGGVIGGLSVIAAVGFLLSLGLAQLPEPEHQSGMYLASLIAGGMGALLSVLFGMTSGSLRLHTLFANAESGRGPLVAAGALRPLLGALSGTVAYVLLQSGLVPLDVPDGAAGTHFFIALAIVAGFSERWARGVLAGTEERVAGRKAAA